MLWMLSTLVGFGSRSSGRSRTAVVLLHGFVGSGVGSWGYQIEALSDAFTVIAWDGPEPAIHQPCRNCSGGRLCGLSFRVLARLGLRSPVCRGGFVRRCGGARARPPAR